MQLLGKKQRHGKGLERLVINAAINHNKIFRVVVDLSGPSASQMVGKRITIAVGLTTPGKPANQAQVMHVASCV